jgi:cold shock CspA family protein
MDAGGAVRFNGTVKKLIPASSDGKPAIGFIECPETAAQFEGRDVFMNDQLVAQLQVGQAVSFSVQLNAKGHPQAVDVATQDGTEVHVDHSQPKADHFIGTVKKLIPASQGKPAIGFIECPETAALYEGRDVFVNDQLCAQLQLGQTVSFAVQLNDKGHPQAVNIVGQGGSNHAHTNGHVAQNCKGHGKGQGKGFNQPYAPTGQRLCQVLLPEVGPALDWGMQRSVAQALLEAGEALGVANEMLGLMSASGGGGYGKTGCGAKGCVVAPYQAAAGGWGKASAGKAKPPATDGWGKAMAGKSKQPAQPATEGSQPYVGQVKKIQSAAQTGRNHSIGFVHSEETFLLYGQDVFLNSEQADSVQMGQTVYFDVVLNKNGQPQAINLT